MTVKKTTAYKQKFNEQAYDRLAITIPKGQKTTVQAAANMAGESVNQYTNKALLTVWVCMNGRIGAKANDTSYYRCNGYAFSW